MMHNSSMPASIASSPMIWMTGLVSPSRSTSGNISFCTAVEAGYCRVPRPAAVMTALRTLAMSFQTSREGSAGMVRRGFVLHTCFHAREVGTLWHYLAAQGTFRALDRFGNGTPWHNSAADVGTLWHIIGFAVR